MRRRVAGYIEKADKEENIRTFIIWGLKCTGKTFTVLDYVKSNYEEMLYIDCSLKEPFGNSGEKTDLTGTLSSYYEIEPDYLINIPIVLDEPSKDMISSGFFDGYNGLLKLFILVSDKNRAEMLEEKIPDSRSFRLLPMDFGEFLIALDKEWYDEIITGHMTSRRKLPDMIHNELLDLFELYRLTGGMPEVIGEYIKTSGTENLGQKQDILKKALVYDSMLLFEEGKSFSKVVSVLNATQSILEKDNRKFMYSAIRDGAVKSSYEPVIDFLCSLSLLYRINKINDDNSFRLYFGDFGFQGKNPEKDNLESVIVQNVLSSGSKLYYWESGTGAVLDMLLRSKDKEIPIEVKVNGKSNLRSVKAFLKTQEEKTYYSISEDNFFFKENVTGIPFYASYAINKL